MDDGSFDSEIRQGLAMCILARPELSELSDGDGHVLVRESNVPPELIKKVYQAGRSFPKGANRSTQVSEAPIVGAAAVNHPL